MPTRNDTVVTGDLINIPDESKVVPVNMAIQPAICLIVSVPLKDEANGMKLEANIMVPGEDQKPLLDKYY
jgi:hypothetical protein